MYMDQLRLLEWRRAGLARRTHALLVLLVPRGGLLRDLALFPPRRLPEETYDAEHPTHARKEERRV